jgi:hypothetical protein
MFATSRKSSDPTRRIQPTQAARKPGSVLTGSPPCTCSHLLISNITQDVTRPTQLAVRPRVFLFLELSRPIYRGGCYQCLICISCAISYRVRRMHLPAQALTKSSDLTYPKAKGKLAQGARMSIRAAFWPGGLNNTLAFHLGEPRFYGAAVH